MDLPPQLPPLTPQPPAVKGVAVNSLLTLFRGPVTTTQALSVVATLVGLAVSFAVITAPVAQAITGVASILIPAAVTIAEAIISLGHSHVHAAQIRSGVVASDQSKPGS